MDFESLIDFTTDFYRILIKCILIYHDCFRLKIPYFPIKDDPGFIRFKYEKKIFTSNLYELMEDHIESIL